MPDSPWRRVARREIIAALESGRTAGLEGQALERHVEAVYPFGQRALHPYQIWRSEFALLVRQRPRQRPRKSAALDQPMLFPVEPEGE